MNNTVIQKFITDFGDRIFCINLDNTRFIYIGYNGGPKLSEISLETIEGVDFIVISKTDSSSRTPVKFKTYHVTDSVQWIGIMDEGYAGYGVDPLKMR